MASLNEFSRRITVRASRIADNVDALVRKTAIAVDRVVVTATPVDQGRAKSNWIASLGVASTRVREPFAPGEKGSTSAENAVGAMAQAAGVIAARRAGQDIHITNNLPYISELNDGSSLQAPAGFVEEAVKAGSSLVQRTKVVD